MLHPRYVESLELRTMLSGGGGDVPPPAIPPGTFEGIGPGPVYARESFGFEQGSRYKKNGQATEIFIHDGINGIRAEFPNNATESWISPPEVVGGQEWDFSVTAPADPYQAYTPLDTDPRVYNQGGTLSINGSDPLGGVDLRPNALLPFAAPTSNAYTASVDAVPFFSKTAIGFSSSGALNRNFETAGEVWLEVDFRGNFPAGGNTFINTFAFHLNGETGQTIAGTFTQDAYGYNRLAVSYDPVNHIAAASVNGQFIAQVPYDLSAPISYSGVEGSWYATVNNFVIQRGAVTPNKLTPARPIRPHGPTGGSGGGANVMATLPTLVHDVVDHDVAASELSA